jgi:hypothetical protein
MERERTMKMIDFYIVYFFVTFQNQFSITCLILYVALKGKWHQKKKKQIKKAPCELPLMVNRDTVHHREKSLFM